MVRLIEGFELKDTASYLSLSVNRLILELRAASSGARGLCMAPSTIDVESVCEWVNVMNHDAAAVKCVT